jgi:hypothetical protein
MEEIMSVGAHVGTVVSASAEIREDVGTIGSAHGMLLLCGSHICKELNSVRSTFVAQDKELEKTTLGMTKLQKPLNALLNVLTSKTVTVGLALGGLTAALMEVFRDTRPGGHHGAVFLAMNSLCDLLEQSRVAKGRLLKVCENVKLRLFLLINATIYSSMETIRDFKLVGTPKLGAHRGVLWLALSKTFKVILKLLKEEAKVA